MVQTVMPADISCWAVKGNTKVVMKFSLL